MGKLLNRSSSLSCPHGGTVNIVTSNARVRADGDYVVRASDTFTIIGCPFTLPSGTPHPCVSVRWVTTCLKHTVVQNAPLANDSNGLCLAADQAPQGVVTVNSTQAKVSGL